MAAADVNPIETGPDMKSIRNPGTEMGVRGFGDVLNNFDFKNKIWNY